MRLTTFTDYALRLLLVLAGDPARRVTIDTFAADFGISTAHLMKVSVVLGRTGWVETVRGRNGGLQLAADPTTLRLGQMVRHLEADFAIVECFTETGNCLLAGACGLETAMASALDAFTRELDRVTLADLVRTSPGLGRLPSVQVISGPASRRGKA
ncbi:MAG: Rrf2 family transcriptional regulator [Burkholderiales bacterium]|nr:MAG: Rrf2 family transcriptional regulator [Burkholderiales bacterium]